MSALAVSGGLLLVLTVLWDAFETIILSRRVSRRMRLARLFYVLTWTPWKALVGRFQDKNRRENYLGFYGPLSILFLLVLWAAALIVGFALLHWGLGSRIRVPEGLSGFAADLYLSGTNFFTLGLGDVTPETNAARALTVVEAGTGFGFLALVIGYLPVLYQAFSRRETHISLLDARAGSPPTAAELLRRNCQAPDQGALEQLLHDWERSAAELLESHVSFPVVAFFRSQHDNQSWVAALTTVLDSCSLVIAGTDGAPLRAARLTFAMARHALVDMCAVFLLPVRPLESDRLPSAEMTRLRQSLALAGVPLAEGEAVERRLAELRGMYEPYANTLAAFLLMPLPAWVPPVRAKDNWQTTGLIRE